MQKITSPTAIVIVMTLILLLSIEPLLVAADSVDAREENASLDRSRGAASSEPFQWILAASRFPIPVAETGTSENAIYFVCRGPEARNENKNEVESRSKANTRECCSAIRKVASTLIPFPLDSEESRVLFDSCSHHVTELPLLPIYNKPNKMHQQQTQRFSFLYTPISHQSVSSGWMPPSAISFHINNDDQQQRRFDQRIFQWYESTQTLELLDDGSEAAVDFALYGTIEKKEVDNFQACIVSVMSDSGGMHRDLRHKIHIQLPEQLHIPQNAFYNISLDMLFFLPADLFVNVEDMIVVPHSAVADFVLLNVIDQEEPTFTSPSHAFLVRIHNIVAAMNDTAAAITVQWTTKVHLRYPTPLDSSASFSRIVMVPPVLVGGQITIANSGDDGSGENTKRVLFLDMKPTHCSPPELLVLWVAAGWSDDCGMVLVTTLAVALWGAIVMFRDISRVTKWE